MAFSACFELSRLGQWVQRIIPAARKPLGSFSARVLVTSRLRFTVITPTWQSHFYGITTSIQLSFMPMFTLASSQCLGLSYRIARFAVSLFLLSNYDTSLTLHLNTLLQTTSHILHPKIFARQTVTPNSHLFTPSAQIKFHSIISNRRWCDLPLGTIF